MHVPARRPLLWIGLALLAFASSMQPVLAEESGAPGSDINAQFLQATQKFEEARAGSATAVAPAQAAFHALLANDSSNPLYMAYYGSTFAMQARDGGAPWQKIKLVNQGIDRIDQALSLLGPQHDQVQIRGVPLSLETRLVAIATYVSLPSLFNRMPVARQQLATVMASPLFASASPEMRGRFSYEEALIAQSDGDKEHERRALREVVKYAPSTLNMNEVRDQLAKLGG